MQVEKHRKSQQLFTDFAQTSLNPDRGEHPKLTLIGGIFFDQGRKIVLIGRNGKNNLDFVFADTPTNFDVQHIIEGSKRIVDLRDYDEIMAAQIQMVSASAITIGTFPSFHEAPYVRVKLEYTDPTTQEKIPYIADEDEILRVFTGEQGGLAILDRTFVGKEDVTEDIALVLERKVANRKEGFVFFFHPEEGEEWGAHSFVGLEKFLERLNDNFSLHADQPLQKQALETLDREIKSGRLTFKSKTHEQIFRTQVIANARLAAKTKDPKYAHFLDTHLPSLRFGLLAQVAGILSGNIRSLRAAKSVEVLNLTAPEKPTAPAQPAEKEWFAENLITKRAISLRRKAEGYLHSDNETSRAYFKELLKIINKTEVEGDLLDDVGRLLGEFDQSVRDPMDETRLISNPYLSSLVPFYFENLDFVRIFEVPGKYQLGWGTAYNLGRMNERDKENAQTAGYTGERLIRRLMEALQEKKTNIRARTIRQIT